MFFNNFNSYCSRQTKYFIKIQRQTQWPLLTLLRLSSTSLSLTYIDQARTLTKGSTNLGVSLFLGGPQCLGVPKRNGMRAIWESEDPFGVCNIVVRKQNKNKCY